MGWQHDGGEAKDNVRNWGLGSPCPHCGAQDGTYEMGPTDRPGYVSVRLTCVHCGHRHKQDVHDPDHDPDEVITVIDHGC